MSRVRDIANILSGGSSAIATDAEVSVVSAQIPSQASGKNIIINGGFDVWQRGTSFTGITAGNTYVADRWTTGTAGSYNIYVSRQPTGDTVNLPNIQYCLRFGRTSGTSGANWNTLNTSLETINSIPFAGKTITLSFYARAGANFSSSGSTLASFLLSGTGVDQNVAVSYTGQLYSYGGHTLTTSWQRFTNTYTVPTNATELSISLQYVPTGTAGANDYYEVTGVQLEASSVPTPFSRAGGNIQGELALCHRYYENNYPNNLTPGYNMQDSGLDFGTIALSAKTAVGGTNGANRSRSQERTFMVQKRSSPSIQFWDWIGNASKYSGGNADGSLSNNNLSVDQYGGIIQTNKTIAFQTVTASSAIAYASVMWAASAEL